MCSKIESSATHAEVQQPEFSRIVNVAELSPAQRTFSFEATPRELAALTPRLGVDALKSLNVRATMQILSNSDVLANFSAAARIEQHCVVTLEPLEKTVSIEFTTTYSRDAEAGWGHGEEEFEDLDTDIEPPEPLVNGTIDISEACVEQLALEIDPFPRVQGATFEGYSTAPQDPPRGDTTTGSEKKNPFAVLSKLKTQKENDK